MLVPLPPSRRRRAAPFFGRRTWEGQRGLAVGVGATTCGWGTTSPTLVTRRSSITRLALTKTRHPFGSHGLALLKLVNLRWFYQSTERKPVLQLISPSERTVHFVVLIPPAVCDDILIQL